MVDWWRCARDYWEQWKQYFACAELCERAVREWYQSLSPVERSAYSVCVPKFLNGLVCAGMEPPDPCKYCRPPRVFCPPDPAEV